MKLVRPPTAADWTTFRRFSSRVRDLRLDLKWSYKSFGPSDFDDITLLLDQHPRYLFPNLRSLALFDNAAASYFTGRAKYEQNMMVGWFRDLIQVGPTVLSLHYDLVPFIVPDLPAIKSIRKLTITGSPSSLEGGVLQELALCETVPQLTSLESFSCDMPSWDVLWHLGRLPALQELSVELPSRSTLPDSLQKDSAFFSQLKVLDISQGTHLSIAELFRCSNLGKLTTFSAKPTYNPGDPIEIQVLDLIPHHCRQLQSLCLGQCDRLYTDVHKLAPYWNLRVLTITLHGSIGSKPWKDDDLVPMIEGLPHLERFYVLDESLYDSDSRPRTAFTLGALVNLVEGCSKLEHISMEFDARERSQLKYMSRRKKGCVVRNDSVRHLCVCHSPATLRKRLAAILSELLPHLEVITAQTDSKHISLWKAVAARHTNSPLFRSQTGDAIPRISGPFEGMTLCTLESLGL